MKRLYGSAQVVLIQPCLNSTHDRRGYARYHFSEANRLMDAAVGDRPDHEVLGVMLGAFGTEHGEFEWARFQAAAHITACVQSMHALADILGQLVYLGLGMNLDASTAIQPERNINIYRVAERTPPSHLKDEMQSLVKDPGFAYLSALNNHSKHRSIVSVGFSVDLTGEDELPHGLKFAYFDYDGISYPQRWVRPTLIAEYQRQETHLHAIGNALNAELATRS